MFKYFIFFKNSLLESLAYRTNVFLVLFSQIISLTVFVALWQSIYSQNNQVGEYDLEKLISYYLISGFLSFVILGTDVAWRMSDEINQGRITAFLLKPADYFWATFHLILGKVFFNFILVTLLIFLAAFFNDKVLAEFSLNLTHWIFFAIALFCSLSVYYCLFFLVGSLTFWFGLVAGFNFFSRMLMFSLGGAVVPLDLLPDFLQTLTRLLPFQYIVWLPILIFQGRVDLHWRIFLPALPWIIGLFFLSRFIFKKGAEKYEGFGA